MFKPELDPVSRRRPKAKKAAAAEQAAQPSPTALPAPPNSIKPHPGAAAESIAPTPIANDCNGAATIAARDNVASTEASQLASTIPVAEVQPGSLM